MKETIIYEDVLGTHRITGEVIEDKGKYVTIDDGNNQLYIYRSQIKQRLDERDNQIKIKTYI